MGDGDDPRREDAELVRAALGGSQEAYRRLVGRYQDRVFRLVVRMVRDASVAEELTQDAFVKAFGALEGYDPSRKLSSWLFKIAHNTTIDHLRKSAPTLVPLEASPPDEEAFSPVRWLEDPSVVDPEDAARGRDLARDVEAGIARLDPLYRELLLLRFQEDLSYQEIVEVCDLPMGTVKTRLHRGRKLLAEWLEGRGW